MGHPLGVLPEGNLLLGGIANARSTTLGSLAALPESFFLDVATYLDGADLAKLSCVSSAGYVYGQQEDLWRALVLNCWQGEVVAGGDTLSWQCAYIDATLKKAGRQPPPLRPRQPLSVRGFYSDSIFKAGHCASADIEAEWLARDNLPRRSALTLSVSEFVADFERPNIPVVLTDCMSQWPALREWTPASLGAQFGDVRFVAGGFSVRSHRESSVELHNARCFTKGAIDSHHGVACR
jgi:hypothetical protein